MTKPSATTRTPRPRGPSLGGRAFTRRGFLRIAVAGAAALLLAAPAGLAAAPPGAPARVLVIGFDGMDPELLGRYRAEGIMPHFDSLIARGGLRRLGTSVPPQSPVAWANFITGQNPGGHGIFDFIHRDPATLIPYLSTSEAKPPTRFFKLGSWKFPRDAASVKLLRHGAAFWEILADAGVDATIFKIPSNFPPVECEARSLSGMGTPDILGTYGVFTYVTDDPPQDIDLAGGRVVAVNLDRGRFRAEIPGPPNVYREGEPETIVSVSGVIDPVHSAAAFDIAGEKVVLRVGEWSDWITLRFPLLSWLRHTPLAAGKAEVTGICRLYLMETRPSLRLYITPIQLDPRAPAMPISTPPLYCRELAAATGLFYTQGLPEDTKALEAGVLGDDDYIAQAKLIFDEHMAQFRHELRRFQALDRGFLFFYFNTPDQSSHMFWRAIDGSSPSHEGAARYAGRIREIYANCDRALGEAVAAVDDGNTLIVVMSDHGFAPYNRDFHANTWLWQNGYLKLRPGVKPAEVGFLAGVDWAATQAYALGINGLYVNLLGREKRGAVPPTAREALLEELVTKLQAVTDPATGAPAIKHAYRADRIYSGPYAEQAPDIILGYHRGYRGSDESALGELPAEIFDDNLLKWSGDHCMAADEVPGILAANRPIVLDDPELLDLAPTLLELFGLRAPPEMKGRNAFVAKGER